MIRGEKYRFSSISRATPLKSPGILDWFGFLSAAVVLFLAVCVTTEVDVVSWIRAPASTWALYSTFVGGSVLFVLGVFALMRLVTKGWLRQTLERSRYFAHATLVFYWSLALGMTAALFLFISTGEFPVPTWSWSFSWMAALALDGRKIAYANQPVAFSIIALVHVSAVLSLVLMGAHKFSTRQRSAPHRE